MIEGEPILRTVRSLLSRCDKTGTAETSEDPARKAIEAESMVVRSILNGLFLFTTKENECFLGKIEGLDCFPEEFAG